MNKRANINSYCEHISDERLNEILPNVPATVEVEFYGHIRVQQVHYGMWRFTVELDINGLKCKLSFRSNDEELKLVLEGADYRTFDYTCDEAVDEALYSAVVANMSDLEDMIAAAEEEAAGE